MSNLVNARDDDDVVVDMTKPLNIRAASYENPETRTPGFRPMVKMTPSGRWFAAVYDIREDEWTFGSDMGGVTSSEWRARKYPFRWMAKRRARRIAKVLYARSQRQNAEWESV